MDSQRLSQEMAPNFSPEGMSGGAVIARFWDVGAPVAVITDHFKCRGVVRATRIEVPLELIRSLYPSLSQMIPRCSDLGIEIDRSLLTDMGLSTNVDGSP